MIRLTGYDQNMELLVKEEERILSSKGFIDKDEMYKIMMHLAEKLADYENLEEQGKLLKLPFKPGDTVYELSECFVEPCTVKTIYIEDYTDKEGNSSYMAEIHYDREDCPYVSTEIFLTDIGKTVFLTREEAEKTLKERRREK